MTNYKNIKVKQVSAVDQVYDKMKEFILTDMWKTGTKLPSESDLADMFGVNRLTVRMALQKLNTIGITETRVGEGTYVRTFDLSDHIQNLSEFYMKPELLEDVYEFRRIIEIECARLAIKRATPEDFEELKSRCDKYEEFQEKYLSDIDWYLSKDKEDELLRTHAILDLDIHYQICKMAHNDLILYSFSVAREKLLQYLIIINKQRHKHWKEEKKLQPRNIHSSIYEALLNKDFKTCKKLYLDMVDHKIDLY